MIAAERQARGLSVEAAEFQIAAIASVHAATLATQNLKDFAGSSTTLVNPFD